MSSQGNGEMSILISFIWIQHNTSRDEYYTISINITVTDQNKVLNERALEQK